MWARLWARRKEGQLVAVGKRIAGRGAGRPGAKDRPGAVKDCGGKCGRGGAAVGRERRWVGPGQGKEIGKRLG